MLYYLVIKSCTSKYHRDGIGPLRLILPFLCRVVPQVKTRWKANKTIWKLTPDLKQGNIKFYSYLKEQRELCKTTKKKLHIVFILTINSFGKPATCINYYKLQIIFNLTLSYVTNLSMFCKFHLDKWVI